MGFHANVCGFLDTHLRQPMLQVSRIAKPKFVRDSLTSKEWIAYKEDYVVLL